MSDPRIVHTYAGPAVVPVTVGALERRRFRAYLRALNADFTERRGFLETDFFIQVPASQKLTIRVPTW